MNQYSDLIIRFVNGDIDPWEWDDFISTTSKEKALRELKIYCSDVQVLFPVEKGECGYCNENGVSKLIQAADKFNQGQEDFLIWLNGPESGKSG